MDRSKWEYKKLGEVCKVINGLWTGKKPPFVNVGVIRNANFTKSCELDSSNIAYIDVEKKSFEQRKLIKGDLIIEKSGGSDKQPVGRPVLFNLDGDFSFSNFTSALRIEDQKELDSVFLYKYLRYVYFSGATKAMQSNTTGLHNLDFSKYKAILIPIAPIADQQRIVAELDCLNEMIAVKQEQLKEFDKLTQSIFYDMFGDPLENVHGWHCDILANLVSEDCSISYGIVQPGDDVEDGVPVVRPVDLTSSVVYRKGLKVVDKAISDSYKRTILKGNELLFCVRGTTGIMSFASEELNGCNVTRGITPLSFSEKVDRTYIYYLLATPYLQSIIAEKTNGIALKQINMRDVRQLPILLPPLSLQQQFADKISAIDAQKELVKQSIAETQSLLDYTMDFYFN